jgi:UDP-N-acetylglucosamine 2-epimerase (non-hydrolysing)
MVQGDTSSALAMAIESFHRKIPVIHLEAGLRTYDYSNPYPEEMNRRLISNIASIHLCPTNLNKQNLIQENIQGDIYVVGNTGLDGIIEYREKCSYEDKVLVTLHRRENHNDMAEWFKSVDKIASQSNMDFMIPLHPNPNVSRCMEYLKHLTVNSPMSHEALLDFMVKCKIVITDSGGIQEECSFLGKKCLVCRKVTERPEAIGKSSFMVESPDRLKEIYNSITDYEIDGDDIYGDGKSSSLICDIMGDLKL